MRTVTTKLGHASTSPEVVLTIDEDGFLIEGVIETMGGKVNLSRQALHLLSGAIDCAEEDLSDVVLWLGAEEDEEDLPHIIRSEN